MGVIRLGDALYTGYTLPDRPVVPPDDMDTTHHDDDEEADEH